MTDKTNQDPAIGPADPLAEVALDVMESAQHTKEESSKEATAPEEKTPTSDEDEADKKNSPKDQNNSDEKVEPSPLESKVEAPSEAENKSTEAVKDTVTAAAETDASSTINKTGEPQEEVKETSQQDGNNETSSAQKSSPEVESYGGVWSAIFNSLVKIGPLVLIACIACLSWPDFWRPDDAIYCPAEIKGITAFLHSVAQGSWLYPVGLEHGTFSAPQWPGFYWFIGLLALIPGIGNTSLLLPLAEALAATLAVLGVWALVVTAGFGARAAFAAGLILLCTPLFAPLPHFMGPAAFAAACMIWSILFLYRGWRANFGLLSLPLGFLLAGLAGLSGGVLQIAVPLLASICFLIWSGKLRRSKGLDALAGFALMLCILGIWLGWVILNNDSGKYLPDLFDSSVRFSLHPLWFLGLAAGIIGTMPWLLMIFGVSWINVGKHAGQTLTASRRENGSAFLWTSFIFACAISVIVPAFHPAAVAIACLLCILLGKAVCNLSRIGNPFFFLLASLALIIAGSLILCMSYATTQTYLLNLLPIKINPLVSPTLLTLSAAPIMGGIVLAGGLFGLFFGRRSRHCGALIYAMLLVIVLTQVGRLMLVPELAAKPDLPLLHYKEIVLNVEQALASPVTSTPGITSQVDTPTIVPPQPQFDAPDGANIIKQEDKTDLTPKENGTSDEVTPEKKEQPQISEPSTPTPLNNEESEPKTDATIMEKQTETISSDPSAPMISDPSAKS